MRTATLTIMAILIGPAIAGNMLTVEQAMASNFTTLEVMPNEYIAAKALEEATGNGQPETVTLEAPTLAADEVPTVPELDNERAQAKAAQDALAQCQATLLEIAPMARERARQLFAPSANP